MKTFAFSSTGRLVSIGLLAVMLAGCGSAAAPAAPGTTGGAATTTAPATASAATASSSSASSTTQSAQASGPTLDAALAADLPVAIRQAGVIKAAVDPSFPVNNFYAADGTTLQGVSPELAAAIGTVLGVKVQLTAEKLTGILPALQSGRYDMAAMVLADTAVREKQVDLVDFENAGQQFLVAAGNPHHINQLGDLCGNSVAVNQGGAPVAIVEKQSADCTAAGKPAVVIHQYPAVPQTVLAVEDGQADATIADITKTSYEAEQSNGKLEAAGTQFAPSMFGFAVAKSDPGLSKAVAGAIDQLIQDGTYGSILAKWHVEQTAMKQVVINGAASAATGG